MPDTRSHLSTVASITFALFFLFFRVPKPKERSRDDTMQIRNWPSYHPLLVSLIFLAGVTIASTLQRQLPGSDPWNLRSNQLVLINPDDYSDSPAQQVQVKLMFQGRNMAMVGAGKKLGPFDSGSDE